MIEVFIGRIFLENLKLFLAFIFLIIVKLYYSLIDPYKIKQRKVDFVAALVANLDLIQISLIIII